MAHDIDYGNLNKRIVFTENDHRHAKFIIRLRQDSLKQSEFFRHIVTGYIDGNENIQNFVDEIKQQSQNRKTKSRRTISRGQEILKDLALDEGEIENIFDILEEEHPEL
jgi:hypothetical protein|tara:strand:+ start:165 stop:491 length:327 start_codon:yes stop_codon:yes gene_type:complete